MQDNKFITNLDIILKSRDITLPKKICLVKAMVLPVVMYGCESCTIKKLSAEELMILNCGVGEIVYRVPWSAWRSNQPILKEISPDYLSQGLMLMLKLKLRNFGYLMQRANSLEKTLMLGKTEGRRSK